MLPGHIEILRGVKAARSYQVKNHTLAGQLMAWDFLRWQATGDNIGWYLTKSGRQRIDKWEADHGTR